jgi:hypothetical protein
MQKEQLKVHDKHKIHATSCKGIFTFLPRNESNKKRPNIYLRRGRGAEWEAACRHSSYRMKLKLKNKTVSNGIFSELTLTKFTPWS